MSREEVVKVYAQILVIWAYSHGTTPPLDGGGMIYHKVGKSLFVDFEVWILQTLNTGIDDSTDNQ